MPSRRRLDSRVRRAFRASCGRSLVVMKTCSRSTPLSFTALPTSASFLYSVAVSMWRYPTSSAARTDSYAVLDLSCHVPKPTIGSASPPANFTV